MGRERGKKIERISGKRGWEKIERKGKVRVREKR